MSYSYLFFFLTPTTAVRHGGMSEIPTSPGQRLPVPTLPCLLMIQPLIPTQVNTEMMEQVAVVLGM